MNKGTHFRNPHEYGGFSVSKFATKIAIWRTSAHMGSFAGRHFQFFLLAAGTWVLVAQVPVRVPILDTAAAGIALASKYTNVVVGEVPEMFFF